MFTVYVLESQVNSKHYIGSTINIERRLQEHNNNKTRSLINKGPFKIIYSEQYSTLKEARKRERIIKSYKGGNAFRKLISRA